MKLTLRATSHSGVRHLLRTQLLADNFREVERPRRSEVRSPRTKRRNKAGSWSDPPLRGNQPAAIQSDHPERDDEPARHSLVSRTTSRATSWSGVWKPLRDRATCWSDLSNPLAFYHLLEFLCFVGLSQTYF